MKMKIMLNGNPVEVSVGAATVQGQDVYSTEEQRIGTWIDGKPLYCIVTYIPTKAWNIGTTWQNVRGPIEDLETPVSLQGYLNNGSFGSLPAYTASGNAACNYNPTAVSGQAAGINVQVNHSGYSKCSFIFILQYTKTTDTATTQLSDQPLQALAAQKAPAFMPVTAAYSEEV